MSLRLGERAPSFGLINDRGKTVSLNSLRGKHVVLFFYPKDETPTCTKEACSFRDLWKEIEATGAIVYGISPDSQESHRTFRQNHSLPYSLLCDPDLSVIKAYGAWGRKRKWYGRQVEGVIRSTVLVDSDGMIEALWNPVEDAESHPAKVLSLLRGDKP